MKYRRTRLNSEVISSGKGSYPKDTRQKEGGGQTNRRCRRGRRQRRRQSEYRRKRRKREKESVFLPFWTYYACTHNTHTFTSEVFRHLSTTLRAVDTSLIGPSFCNDASLSSTVTSCYRRRSHSRPRPRLSSHPLLLLRRFFR